MALLLRPPGEIRNAQQRQHEELVASYLQRYCAKNDSIGFFGPVGWARFVPAGPPIAARPGAHLLATRNVYFEAWCIDALAETIARDEALLPRLAPRRLPFVHVEKTTLHLPFAPPSTLPALHAAVLQACDGELTAKEIARNLLRNPFLGLKRAEEVYAILAELKRLGRITWTLEAPFELRPERSLRKLLERIEEQRLREPALAMLDELEAARDRIAAAAGAPDALARALDELETAFTRMTGQSPTRLEGKVYAARTLVYEDCRRDIDLALGPDVLEALSPPLGLLLTSGRTLPIGSLVLEDVAGKLIVRTRDRKLSFALIEAFGEGLSPITAHHLKILAPGRHTPRVTIDRLVVCRETWRFTVAELPFGLEMDAAARFLMARRWARDHGLPRFVFVGAPGEAKSFFVDFDSPIYVDILAKVLRRIAPAGLEDAPITVTEMLPRLDQLWLPDAARQRYTSELRIVAVDRARR